MLVGYSAGHFATNLVDNDGCCGRTTNNDDNVNNRQVVKSFLRYVYHLCRKEKNTSRLPTQNDTINKKQTQLPQAQRHFALRFLVIPLFLMSLGLRIEEKALCYPYSQFFFV